MMKSSLSMSKKQKLESTVLYFTSPLTPSSIPSPLSLAYHPPSCRHLSTSVPTEAPGELSTVAEIDSAFCPQCFTSWDPNSAFNTANGSCVNLVDNKIRVGCLNCPICESTVVVTVQDINLYHNILESAINEKNNQEEVDLNATHICFYKCGYCQWDSIHDLKLYSKLNINDPGKDETELTKQAAQQIQIRLTTIMEERKNSVKPLFNTVVNTWNEKIKSQEIERRKMELLDFSRPGSSRSGKNKSNSISIANTCSILSSKEFNNSNTGGNNSVQLLDEFIDNQKKNYMKKQVFDSILKDADNSSINKFTFSDLSKADTQRNKPKWTQSLSQLTVSSSNISNQSLLLPIPVKLRTRAVRRDCRELGSGKPGILVKPKVNPLEGDSSLRYGQGQWWKKDSSAIHTVPRLSIYNQCYNTDSGYHALLIRISNPTLGPIRLTIHTNFETTTENSFVSSIQCKLNNLILRLFPLTLVNSYIIPANNCKKSMDIISLDPMEDTFIDLTSSRNGNNSNKSKELQNWPNTIDWSSSQECDCKLIYQQQDTAYVQFMVWNDKKVKDMDESYISTPLALDIEIGDGSWESSLIQKKPLSDDKKDFVTFIVLPTWKANRR